MKPLKPALLSLTLSISLAAIAGDSLGPGAAASSPATTENAARLLERIKLEIGEAPCDNDLQCFSLAIGWRACGGPEAYLSWSAKETDRSRLAKLAVEHQLARQGEVAASGMASDCRSLPNPGAVCRLRNPDGKRVCQLGSGGQNRLD